MESLAERSPKRETRVEKARRLVREGRVVETGPGVYEVDSNKKHHVSLNLDCCSCPVGGYTPGAVCAHRLAAEVFASFSRRVA